MFTNIMMIDYRQPLRDTSRHCYRWTPSKPNRGRGFYQSMDGLYMDKAGSTIDLRIEMANDHLSGRLSHVNGYYCDEYGDGDTLQPIIARLPRGRGFLAGWTMGRGMCGCVGAHVYKSVEDAARDAHSMAEEDGIQSIADNAMERELEMA